MEEVVGKGCFVFEGGNIFIIVYRLVVLRYLRRERDVRNPYV